MQRIAVWMHAGLATYVILLVAMPIGRWNAAGDDALIPALLQHRAVQSSDIAQMLFALAPFFLVLLGRGPRGAVLLVGAIIFDSIWAAMHYFSWWSPYITGRARPWQIAYAKGPTIKVLSSVGSHIPPDGMHTSIDILLVGAMLSAIAALASRISARRIAGGGIKVASLQL
jgi:hypothetical protein